MFVVVNNLSQIGTYIVVGMLAVCFVLFCNIRIRLCLNNYRSLMNLKHFLLVTSTLGQERNPIRKQPGSQFIQLFLVYLIENEVAGDFNGRSGTKPRSPSIIQGNQKVWKHLLKELNLLFLCNINVVLNSAILSVSEQFQCFLLWSRKPW